MSNISFDNPWLLFIALAMLIMVTVSFFLAIKKGSFNFHNITSYILHVVIIILVGLAISGMNLRKVITKTEVYVLADVSYSNHNNLDTIDEYIADVKKNLPDNSKLGIICFGADYEILVNPGEKIKSVKESKCNNTETNIYQALEYTQTLFTGDAIKRIVIISDGKQTNEKSFSSLISEYENNGIHVDCMYVDNNIKESTYEIQISNVNYNQNTYLNKEESATFTIESNRESKATINLYLNDEVVDSFVESLSKGTNNLKVDLNTTKDGTYNYKIEVVAFDEGNGIKYDTETNNNILMFEQNVSSVIKVLFISDKQSDLNLFKENYDENIYEIDAYIADKDVPYLVEDLCKYDEYVISDTSVATLSNADTFVKNLDICVSEFGKSLLTIGNMHIQNGETDSVLKEFGGMLPVKFDNQDNKKRLYTIILDSSKSMDQVSHFIISKQCCLAVLDLLTENDDFMVITFYGDVETVYPLANATKENIEAAKVAINNLISKQATSLGAGLKAAYEKMHLLDYQRKECLLISDGKSYSGDEDLYKEYSAKMGDENIHVSVVYVKDKSNDKEIDSLVTIKNNSKGLYFEVYDEESCKNVVTNDIADEVTETHKEGDFKTAIKKTKDDLVTGIASLANISDFYTSINKSTSTQVLSIYEKTTEYPLYSTWSYGNGTVSTFTVNISSTGLKKWKEENSNGLKVIKRFLEVNIPEIKNDSPFNIELSTNGSITDVVVNAPTMSADSLLTLNVTYPSGKTYSTPLSYDSSNYVAQFDSTEIGTYLVEVSFKLGSLSYTGKTKMDISYYEEYDQFEVYDASSLYSMVTKNGKVSENGKLTIDNTGLTVSTFNYEFATLFFVISVVLFVVDVIIRKLRWQDIKSLFMKKKKEVK